MGSGHRRSSTRGAAYALAAFENHIYSFSKEPHVIAQIKQFRRTPILQVRRRNKRDALVVLMCIEGVEFLFITGNLNRNKAIRQNSKMGFY